MPGPDGACGDAARAAAGVAISTGKLGRPPNVSGEVYLCHSTAISVHFFIYVCIFGYIFDGFQVCPDPTSHAAMRLERRLELLLVQGS